MPTMESSVVYMSCALLCGSTALIIAALSYIDNQVMRLHFHPEPRSPFSSIATIIRDYSSGRYYKPWSNSRPIIVTSKRQIAELSDAAQQLSQRAVYADLFGFQHTLNKLDHHEVSTARTRLSNRVIQVNGLSNLPKIHPLVQKRLPIVLEEQMKAAKKRADGSISLPIAPTMRTLTIKLMSLIFFGEKLSSEDEFAEALSRYPREMVSCLTAFQITPSWLSPLAHKIITRGGKSMHTILDKLVYILGEGREDWDEQQHVKELTFAWNMADLSKGSQYWSGPEHLAQSLLGLWFASAHQPWMNLHFIILELCLHQDWQSIIREEVQDSNEMDYETLQNLPLLDSFIKETIRLHPTDSLAIRRKALNDYTFTGGSPFVPAGSTVCTSAYDLMHDERDYPNSNTFEPIRFLGSNQYSRMRGTKFTDVSHKFPVWGYGSLACPGRFHASLVMKMIVAELVAKYDLSLENEKARTMWSWETFTLPYESARFVLKERNTA